MFTDKVVIGAAEGLTEAQVFANCGPLIAELSSAAPQIREIYRKDQPVAVDTFRLYNQAMQKLFDSPEFLKLEIIDQ